ncbi:MAG TPA: T9SS type A sorting domain-containing protein, partial [Saprospiraceae bacterium]|nr:T9SS type A sorting domain-containing protein [Saprospiraceae bacterium]
DFNPGPETFYLTSIGPDDIFITKLDDSGNFEWGKAINGLKEEAANAIALDASGHVYIAGFYNGPTILFDTDILTNAEPSLGTADIFIAKLDQMTTALVHPDAKTPSIDIFPNPVKDEIVIKFSDKEVKDFRVTLYSLKGEVVLYSVVHDIAGEYPINISGLPAEMYMVEVNANGNRLVEQVVKAQE